MPIENGAGGIDAGMRPTSCLGCRNAATAAANGVALVMEGADVASVNGDNSPCSAVDADGTDKSPEPSDGDGEGETHGQQPSSSGLVEDAMVEMGATVGGIGPAEQTTADAQALVTMRRELDGVKSAASGLESALRESRSEVLQLRELLATEEDTARKQAGKISSLRYPAVASSRAGNVMVFVVVFALRTIPISLSNT